MFECVNILRHPWFVILNLFSGLFVAKWQNRGCWMWVAGLPVPSPTLCFGLILCMGCFTRRTCRNPLSWGHAIRARLRFAPACPATQNRRPPDVNGLVGALWLMVCGCSVEQPYGVGESGWGFEIGWLSGWWFVDLIEIFKHTDFLTRFALFSRIFTDFHGSFS